jgi:predicted nuclease of predicted toxin-antitoxin system
VSGLATYFLARAKCASWGSPKPMTALVSLDVDFADRAILIGPPPKVIWLRCGNLSTEIIEKLLRDHLEAIVAFEHDTAACLEIY